MTKFMMLSRAAATAAAALVVCLLAGTSTALASSSAHSGGENTPLNLGAPSSTQHASSGGASIVRTIVGLAIVIAVIWGLTWVLRQVKAGRDPHVGSGELGSIAALTLSSGRSVHLVRAGSEYVLLGSGEHGVVPIHRYTEEEARAAGLIDGAEPETRSRAVVRRVVGPPSGGPYDPTRVPSQAAGVLERLREWTVRR